jgi:NAD(P)-dependent dehydrogenase (short-subunit alcohol dehydrogenase family)
MVERAVNEFGGLDIIYNNAGFGGALGPPAEIKVEDCGGSASTII